MNTVATARAAQRSDRAFYLPSYSPQLNPEERLNADLKQEMDKRVPVRTKAKLRAAANEHMAMLEKTPERVMSYFQFRPLPYDASKGIQLGALVCLVDADDKQQLLFLGPVGGSMTLVSGAQPVQVISSESPLGKAMLGKCECDAVSIQIAPTRQQFEVLRVH